MKTIPGVLCYISPEHLRSSDVSVRFSLRTPPGAWVLGQVTSQLAGAAAVGDYYDYLGKNFYKLKLSWKSSICSSPPSPRAAVGAATHQSWGEAGSRCLSWVGRAICKGRSQTPHPGGTRQGRHFRDWRSPCVHHVCVSASGPLAPPSCLRLLERFWTPPLHFDLT